MLKSSSTDQEASGLSLLVCFLFFATFFFFFFFSLAFFHFVPF